TIASILVNDEPIGLGTIVDAEGFIVTKASFVNENIQCRLADGRIMKATVCGSSDTQDLALLKIDARHLPVVPWRSGALPPPGSLLAAVGTDENPLAFGVIGAEQRPIPGVLGAAVALSEDGAVRVIFLEDAS